MTKRKPFLAEISWAHLQGNIFLQRKNILTFKSENYDIIFPILAVTQRHLW